MPSWNHRLAVMRSRDQPPFMGLTALRARFIHTAANPNRETIADEGLRTEGAFNGFAGALEAIADFIDLRKVTDCNDVQHLLRCLDEHRARF